MVTGWVIGKCAGCGFNPGAGGKEGGREGGRAPALSPGANLGLAGAETGQAAQGLKPPPSCI